MEVFMKWMVSINDLDAVQARAIESIIDNQDENHWVKGFAGSGKTIVLTHVLERLATAKPPVKVCFTTYTHALKDLVESGLSTSAKQRIDISTFNSLGKLRNNYDLVVADEMQDIPSKVLPTLARKSDVLIIAADLDQSIYRSACSVSELNNAIKPAQEHQLREIHRINENVFEIATSVYADASVASQTTIRQDDEETRIYEGSSMRDEFVTMYEEAVRVSAKESPSAILLPSKALLDKFISTIAVANSYAGTPPSAKERERPEIGEQADPFKEVNAYLKRNKSPLQVFGGGSGSLYESDTKKMVYLMTYHSAKGLDFANVFLPHLTDDVSLEPMKGASDAQERRLFFVASTRARERLYLSYHGEPHRFIEEIPDHLLETFSKQKRTY
jgi:Ni2+-binding GTPase involved in maturation of urease and hydrogenase